jgi:hypothetical protein
MTAREIPAFAYYPRVQSFVDNILAMQLADVRTMMLLPLPEHGLTSGCNFAATAVLCNIISGVSVSLFKPLRTKKSNRGNRHPLGTGDLFKRLLWTYYPCGDNEQRIVFSRLMYKIVRNPDTIRRPGTSLGPKCCGWRMVPVLPEADGLDPEAAADPWADRRADDRWPARPGTWFEVRQDEHGPNLAVALVDVSAAGLRAAVRGPLSAGAQVVVVLAPPGDGWVCCRHAVVCWRAEGAEGTALAGLQFRTPLSPLAAADLTEPDLG